MFVIGCGSGAIIEEDGDESEYSVRDRKNALEVYDDGTIKINKVQGDISMGIYGS